MAQSDRVLRELFVDPRQLTGGLTFPDPKTIKIYDTTLRDGEQMPGVSILPEHKYVIAKELSQLGCHIIDVGFPSANSSDQRALQLILEARRKGEIREDLEILVTCRANRSDIDATVQAIEEAGFHPAEVTFLIFTSASGLHCKYKLGAALLAREGRSPDELEETPLSFFFEANKKMLCDVIQYAKSRGGKTIEFAGEDSSRTPLEQLIDLAQAAIAAGGTRFVFADTTGSLTPESTRFYCQGLTKAMPQIPRVSHFHNDFDLATINTITALLNGFTIITTTINGLGERAGNAPLHSTVAALRHLYRVEIPGFAYDRLWHVRNVVEEITGIPVQVQEPVIGQNAFSHESGIHTHGTMISRLMYEPIPHESVGAVPRFVYGKHSGSNSLFDLLSRHENEIGCTVDDALVLRMLTEIRRLREAMSVTEGSAAFIHSYYGTLSAKALSESEVVSLAKNMVRNRRSA